MARKKVTLQWIANDSTRRATFKKRRKGLMKKASELATLCDVDACVVVYGEGETQLEVWPDVDRASKVLARFRAMPELDQCKKMMDMEGFLTQRIDKLREQVHKAARDSREIETTLLLNDAILGRRPGLVGLSVEEIAGLGWMVENRLACVRESVERRHRQAAAAAAAGKEPVGPQDDNAVPPAPTAFHLQRVPPPHHQVSLLPPLVPPYSFGGGGFTAGGHTTDVAHHQAPPPPPPNPNTQLQPHPEASSWLMEVARAGGDLGALVYSGFGGVAAGASEETPAPAAAAARRRPPPHLGNFGAGFGWADPPGPSGSAPFPAPM